MNTLILEDHPITAMGLQIAIEENFINASVQIAADGKIALNMVKNETFALIILDINLPQTDTQSLIYNLKQHNEGAEILVCSINDERGYAMSYVSMGASGYIHKSSSAEQIITAIKMVLDGQVYLSKDVLQNSLSKTNKLSGMNKNAAPQFSNRELEVLTHILNGKKIKDISEIMNIHQSTASTLKKRVLQKASVDNIIDLKKKADDLGLI